MTPNLYRAPERRVVLIDVPEMQFLMVDGTGDPNGPEFQRAVQALYKASYGARFRLKKDGVERKVGPLEGMWDQDWSWTAMISQADQLTPEILAELDPDPSVRLARFCEGLCIQTLHVGPYADEPRTVGLLAAYADEHGLEFAGRHHEIYLSDPRRTAPERLRTIIRHPVAKVGHRLHLRDNALAAVG